MNDKETRDKVAKSTVEGPTGPRQELPGQYSTVEGPGPTGTFGRRSTVGETKDEVENLRTMRCYACFGMGLSLGGILGVLFMLLEGTC
jgi:hypothetical protein